MQQVYRIVFLGLLTSWAWAGSVLHKYVNERGETIYTDRIPADAAKFERRELSDQGVITRQVERAKTPEEIARDKRFRELVLLRQRFLDEQKARDDLLLKSFSKEEDLLSARDAKVDALVINIKTAEENITRIQTQILDKQRQAAELERAGSAVPQALRKEIESLRKEVENNRSTIARAKGSQEILRAKYAADLPRLRELLLQRALKRPTVRFQSSYHVWEIYVCPVAGRCEAEWQRVPAYVRAQANTPGLLANEAVVVSAEPLAENEIAVIVTRLPPDTATAQTQFFLDVICLDSQQGRALCDGIKGKTILDRFMPFIRGQF